MNTADVLPTTLQYRGFLIAEDPNRSGRFVAERVHPILGTRRVIAPFFSLHAAMRGVDVFVSTPEGMQS